MKITWLGQAGYRIVADNGTVILIDPYLSDALREKKGDSYCRQIPIREEFLTDKADILVLTHAHDDHMDFGTLDRVLAANPHAAVLGSLGVMNAMRARYGNDLHYMLFDPGVEMTLQGILFEALFASHSGDPISVVLHCDGKVVCHTGDTMYHKRLASELPRQADALIVPINGRGYNMNAVDAARLTKLLEPKTVLPMHWDMFAAYGCDAGEFTRLFAGTTQRILIPEHYAEFEI